MREYSYSPEGERTKALATERIGRFIDALGEEARERAVDVQIASESPAPRVVAETIWRALAE